MGPRVNQRRVLLPVLVIVGAFALFALYLVYVDPPSTSPAQAQAAGAAQPIVFGAPNSIVESPLAQPVRGRTGDLWADVILGKPDFSEIGPGEVVPFKVFNPGGIVVDRSTAPGRAYVWDAGNSRILGLDLEKCYAGESPCSADIVIGQPALYDHSACNGDSGVQNFPNRAPPSAETLCGIPDVSASPTEHKSIVSMAIDGSGALYVPDSFNNRVLRYDNPFGSDARADDVWGQSDFSGMMCNQGTFGSATAETLCFHADSNRYEPGLYGAGVELDSEGNLWVADSGNNRVLRFPASSGSGEISKRADLVLGQRDFRRTAPGESLRAFHTPSALRFDARGRLYVVDTDNERVLVFHPPFTSGMDANSTLGSRFNNPVSLEMDLYDRGVWVNDQRNALIELWNWQGSEVLSVIGKASYQPEEGRGVQFSTIPGGVHIWDATGIAFDAHGNMLVALASFAQDVIRFPISDRPMPGSEFIQPDKRLFYPPGEYNDLGLKGLRTPRGLAIHGDQLVVADYPRLLFWNDLDSLSNGKEADGVIGNEGWRAWANCCSRIKADAAGKLWSLSWEGRHFIDVYQFPLDEHSAPIATLWTGGATYPVLGSGNRVQTGGRIFGLAPVDGGRFLWLSDTDNHRVLRIRNPLTDPVVDVILGQVDADGTKCNRRVNLRGHQPVDQSVFENVAADMLCFPGALSLDRFGNLYVSDHALEVDGNRRLLVFPAERLPSDNSTTLFAARATKVFEEHGGRGANLVVSDYEPRTVIDNSNRGPLQAATWEPAFDSTNRMVVGYNMYVGGRFAGVYDDPLGRGTQPDAYLRDLWSMAYSATFDENDNLYMSDINRGRVLVYRNPFGNPTPPGDGAPTQPAPLPNYPVTVQSVSPEPPFCAVRSSSHGYERRLSLVLEGLPTNGDPSLEFRKIAAEHTYRTPFRDSRIQTAGTRLTMDMAQLGPALWGDHDRVKLTVRVVRGNGEPLSNWSPAFVLADDVAACGVALPTPIPSPTATSTPAPTATPTLTPSPTPTPSPEPTPTPTPTETPTPTQTPTLAPTPTMTPLPTPTPIPPTTAPLPSPVAEVTPTVTPSGQPGSGSNRAPILIITLLVAGVAALAVVAGLLVRRRR